MVTKQVPEIHLHSLGMLWIYDAIYEETDFLMEVAAQNYPTTFNELTKHYTGF